MTNVNPWMPICEHCGGALAMTTPTSVTKSFYYHRANGMAACASGGTVATPKD